MRDRAPDAITLPAKGNWRAGDGEVVEMRRLVEKTIKSLKQLAENNPDALPHLYNYCHDGTPIPAKFCEYLQKNGLYNTKTGVNRHVALTVGNFVEHIPGTLLFEVKTID